MSTSSIEFMEEDFVEVCKHLERLRKLAELAHEFHVDGLERDELKQLFSLLKEAVEHSTGRADLLMLNMLNWLRENIELWLPRGEKFPPKKLKERLPPNPIFPVVYGVRQLVRQWRGLPPPPTLSELVDDFDALIKGFTNELRRHTKLLISFFDVIKPESVPWIIKLIERGQGHVRTSLGEPLCILVARCSS